MSIQTAPDHTRTADICPPWCDEHYTGTNGTRNHSGPADRYVFAEGARSPEVFSVAAWPELRISAAGNSAPVGVVEVATETPGARGEVAEVELSAANLRALAEHLMDVASQLDSALLGRQ